MSESSHSVDVIPVELHPCPGADALSLVRYGGFQVLVRTEDWKNVTQGAYIPPDSLVDTRLPQFAFLAPKAYSDGFHRVRAIKMRGQISYGLLVPAPEAAVVGDDVTKELQVLHYQPEEESEGDYKKLRVVNPNVAEAPRTGRSLCKYDLENARKPKFAVTLPTDGTGEVVVTEKLHGENARYCWDGEKLHVGSRNNWWKEGTGWHTVYERPDSLCRSLPGYTVYGELYGATGGFPYDAGGDYGQRRFRLFDIADPDGNWLPWDVVVCLARQHLVPFVPVLYRGPMDMAKVLELAEGPSTLNPAHVREGVVIGTLSTNRVKLKVHGGGFLAATKKKGGAE